MITVHKAIPGARVRLLIFDLDGTLIDSRLDLTNTVNAMLRHFRRPELPAEVIATYIGDGAPMLVRRALGDPDDQHYFHDALDFFISYYREHKLDHTVLYPGVKDALAAIARGSNGTGRKMAILTNKPVNPSRQIVQALGLADFFAQVYGGNSFHTKKPDPLGALSLLEEMGVAAQEAAIVGDSANDVLTGRNVGMWTVGCKYGFVPEQLQQTPPDVVIDSPQELAQLFAAAPDARGNQDQNKADEASRE